MENGGAKERRAIGRICSICDENKAALKRLKTQKWCKACVLLDGLNRGLPKHGIGRSRVTNGLKKETCLRSVNSVTKESSIQSRQCGTLDF